MLVRKSVTRSGRGFRGNFPSKKLSRMVEWESILERDAIMLFEFSPGVMSYQEQPELISYAHGTSMRRYYPDFEIITVTGIKLHIEIKPSAKLSNPKSAEKYRTIAEHYRSQERQYRILTELEIRQEPLFSNLKKLTQHQRYPESLTSSIDEVTQRLQGGPVPLDSLGLNEAIIWRLMANGYLRSDLSQPITSSTLLSLGEGGCDDTLYF